MARDVGRRALRRHGRLRRRAALRRWTRASLTPAPTRSFRAPSSTSGGTIWPDRSDVRVERMAIFVRGAAASAGPRERARPAWLLGCADCGVWTSPRWAGSSPRSWRSRRRSTRCAARSRLGPRAPRVPLRRARRRRQGARGVRARAGARVRAARRGRRDACGVCRACVRAVPRPGERRPRHPDVVVLERGLYEPATIGRRTPETQDLSIDQVRVARPGAGRVPAARGHAPRCSSSAAPRS